MTFMIDILKIHYKSEYKQVNWNERNRTCANLTVVFLIYNVLRYYSGFWNLFFYKVYFKNK